jgi:hypothetical protein
MRQNINLTAEAFYEDNPIDLVMQSFDGGAFARGLPKHFEFSTQPDVEALFRKLLKDGMIQSRKDDDAIHKRHRNGWTHASVDLSNPFVVCYVFPSPLHAACLSWRLEPTDCFPSFDTLLELSTAVISRFKPSQLYLPIRHVGSQSVKSVPEAQYQDGFYRSVFSVTSRNVRIFPEFASRRGAKVAGRIDFFIPIKRWGIEIIRDGSQSDELC